MQAFKDFVDYLVNFRTPHQYKQLQTLSGIKEHPPTPLSECFRLDLCGHRVQQLDPEPPRVAVDPCVHGDGGEVNLGHVGHMQLVLTTTDSPFYMDFFWVAKLSRYFLRPQWQSFRIAPYSVYMAYIFFLS